MVGQVYRGSGLLSLICLNPLSSILSTSPLRSSRPHRKTRSPGPTTAANASSMATARTSPSPAAASGGALPLILCTLPPCRNSIGCMKTSLSRSPSSSRGGRTPHSRLISIILFSRAANTSSTHSLTRTVGALVSGIARTEAIATNTAPNTAQRLAIGQQCKEQRSSLKQQ